MRTKNIILLLAGLALACSLVRAQRAIEIETVSVGDAGNPDDTTGYGGVSYDYHIGTHEVTNEQYTAFLNAVASTTDTHGLYNTNMGTNFHGGISRSGSSGSYSYIVRNGRGNNPVNYVSFWDGARFANWLTTGDTETGVYNLGGVTSPSNAAITRDADAWAAGGVAIASQDEWYKAAYYSGSPTGADGDGYWLYPTQSNTAPDLPFSPGDGRKANYDAPSDREDEDLDTVTEVGSYTNSGSHYGTFDQGGNVWEWNDTIGSSVSRGLRGGSFNRSDVFLRSSRRFNVGPTVEDSTNGLRVSSLAAIPEPGHAGVLMGALTLWIAVMLKGRPPAGGQAAAFKL